MVPFTSQMLFDCFPSNLCRPTQYSCEWRVVDTRANFCGRQMVLTTDDVQECFTHLRFLIEEKQLALCFTVEIQMTTEILTDTEYRFQVLLSTTETVYPFATEASTPVSLYTNCSLMKMGSPSSSSHLHSGAYTRSLLSST